MEAILGGAIALVAVLFTILFGGIRTDLNRVTEDIRDLRQAIERWRPLMEELLAAAMSKYVDALSGNPGSASHSNPGPKALPDEIGDELRRVFRERIAAGMGFKDAFVYLTVEHLGTDRVGQLMLDLDLSLDEFAEALVAELNKGSEAASE